jgi:hypothetical protein
LAQWPCPAFPEGIVLVIAFAVLLLSIPSSGGVHLRPEDEVPPPPGAEVAAPSPPAGSGRGFAPPLTAALGAAVVGTAILAHRRSRGAADPTSPAAGLALEPPDDALVVFVPGHGNGPEVFDDLIRQMGLDEDQVRIFDYRLATEDLDAADGSMRASLDDSADALNGYLAGLADLDRPIHLVGFSKGGVVTAELLGRWDDGAAGPADSIDSVALLDPPMAAGMHGEVQSLGRRLVAGMNSLLKGTFPLGGSLAADVVGAGLHPIPDDAGYDPVSCSFLFFGCDDERDHLGRASGLDPMVIRNSRSRLTNLADAPDGLRIYDAPTSVGGPWPWEVGAAHLSVLYEPAVADCLVAEMHETGTCGLTPRSAAASPAAHRALESVRRFLDRLGDGR